MKRIFFEIIAIIALFLPQSSFSQINTSGDNPGSSSWLPNCRKIEVISSEDDSIQNCMFLKPTGKEARPLVVSLHTWSGGYDHENSFKNRIKITIFEGGHEQLTDVALDHLERKNILIIGDSNGAAPDSWVEQMKGMDFNNFIYNTSISGNTIGFDNNGQKSLNTLRNIDRFITEGMEAMGRIDAVVIMIGSNDCKAVFNDSLKVVPDNFEKLLQMIKKHPVTKDNHPSLFVVSPPPMGRDEKMIEKYHGGAARIAWLQPRLRKITKKNGAVFIDIYSKLLPEWDKYSKDGIHLTTEGQKIIAEEILKRIK